MNGAAGGGRIAWREAVSTSSSSYSALCWKSTPSSAHCDRHATAP
ncbi:unnamed protein product [Ectocarpus sp. CCAP 1310/34]|nr:unnamed protein product [Ectocarpus sp. CCAP 1310/34]